MWLGDVEVRFDRSRLGVSKAWVRRVIAETLKAERNTGFNISVLLTDNRGIRRINKRYLHHDYATDVIAFDLRPDLLGDVVVSAQAAREMSRRLGIPYREELARYLVHGTLHLLGYRDKTADKKARMHLRQESLLKKLGKIC